MDSNLRRTLESLVGDLIENELDKSRREQLNFMLRDSEQCRMHFNALMDLQCGMTELLGQPREDVNGLETVELPTSPHFRESTKHSKSRLLSWGIVLAGLAASFVIVVGPSIPRFGFQQIANDSKSQETADPALELMQSGNLVRVGQSSSAEYFDGGPTVAGQATEFNREYVLNAGLIMLTFPNGANAIVEGPSVFSVLSPTRLLVKIGRCNIHAPEGAEGFRVDTPQTEVVDLGTRFSVEVSDVGLTEVQVVEGAAEVSGKAGMQLDGKLLLRNGEARRFGDSQAEFGERIEFELDSYRGSLPDRIIAYRCMESNPPVSNLVSLTVQRDGREIEYSTDQLIGIEMIHFVPQKNLLHVATAPSAGPVVRELLESDVSLATGLINPGGSPIPLTTDPVLRGSQADNELLTLGMGFRFKRPIVNGPGPDMVVFDVQSKVDSPNGDGFHVSPLKFSPGLKSYSVTRYDITMKSAQALPIVPFELLSFPNGIDLLDAKLADTNRHHIPSLQFFGLAVGIDFSELGYPLGDSVDGLFIQDDADVKKQVDPVFIAGFPIVDSPKTDR